MSTNTPSYTICSAPTVYIFVYILIETRFAPLMEKKCKHIQSDPSHPLWTILCALKLLLKKGRVVMLNSNVLIECSRRHVTSVVGLLALPVKHSAVY